MLGHTAEVKGVSITQDSDACVSCSTDCTVKLWKVPFAPGEAGPLLQSERPVFEFRGKGAFRGIDHHWGRNSFATAGPQVDIWDHERSEPVNSFTWGADSIMSVRFNPVSPDKLVPPTAWLPVSALQYRWHIRAPLASGTGLTELQLCESGSNCCTHQGARGAFVKQPLVLTSGTCMHATVGTWPCPELPP